jgi:hypothetical protein
VIILLFETWYSVQGSTYLSLILLFTNAKKNLLFTGGDPIKTPQYCTNIKGFENKVREKYISKSQAYTTRQNHGSFQM